MTPLSVADELLIESLPEQVRELIARAQQMSYEEGYADACDEFGIEDDSDDEDDE